MKNALRSSFVARQYMLSRDFELYYYHDVNFKTVESHTHTYYEIYFFVEGAVEMEIRGRRRPLSPGDVIVVPPGVPHRAVVMDGAVPYRRFIFWVTPAYCAELEALAPEYGFLFRHAAQAREYVYGFDMVSFNAVRGKLLALLDEIHADRFAREARIVLNVNDLVLHLNRCIFERTHPSSQQENVSHYEAITAYIDVHLEEPLTLERIASELYLSKFYIAHLFQERTGLSLHQYLIKKRLAACCAAIRGGENATNAAERCGFSEYSSFYRAFRKEYGMSPSEYAEMNR